MSSLKSRLTKLAHDKEVSGLRTKLDQANRDMAVISGQLEQARAAKFAPIAPARTRNKASGDVIRVIAHDVHGAKMNRPAVAAFIADVKRLQPDEIYLLGDIIDCGGFLAAHHVWGYVADTTYTYDDDILAGNIFLDQVRAAAPNAKIEYVEGNHEQRVEKWCITSAMRGGNPRDAEGLLKRNAPQYLLKLAEREINYYRMSECYDGLTVSGTIKRGKIHYTHGSFVTSKNAARDCAAKFSGNVVFANTHRSDIYVGHRPGVGVIGAYNAGCLCELQPRWMNTNPTDWTHGHGVEFVAKSGAFLRVNVPIIDGVSCLIPLLNHEQAA